MQRRYKVLPLPTVLDKTFKLYLDINEDCTEAELKHIVIRQCHYEKVTQIPAVFNRNGYYLDRQSGCCWCEWKGVAWLTNKEEFLYKLNQADSRILNQAEVEAIRTLIAYGSCPENLRQMLREHDRKVILRDNVRCVRLRKLQMLKSVLS